MKRISAIMLLLSVCFGLFGCGQEQTPAAFTEPTEYTGYRVAHPMQYPAYTFDHEPTTDELRQMAVKAMADTLDSTPDVHAIMAIEPAHVVYKENGSIDPDASYIAIQDQRAGQGTGFYNTDIDGQTVFCNGRLYAQYTFTELWNLGYIPLTTAEFLGNEPYTPPAVSCENGVIVSNYPIAMAKMVLVDNEGNETEVERLLLSKRDIASGVARNLPLSNFMTSTQSQSFKELMEGGKTYTLCYRVTVSNAQTFDAYKTPV